MDVHPSDGNLLASCGGDQDVKIYDRVLNFVRKFEKLHQIKYYRFDSRELNFCLSIAYLDDVDCVRWSPRAVMIDTTSHDKTVKVVDFRTEKVLYSETTTKEGKE